MCLFTGKLCNQTGIHWDVTLTYLVLLWSGQAVNLLSAEAILIRPNA